MNESNNNHETANGTKPELDEVLWDDSKSEDKYFLKKWYQYRYEFWASKPKHIGGKVAEHYKKLLRNFIKHFL